MSAASMIANRRSAHKVRSKSVTISLTPGDAEYLDGAARRHGVPVCRLLGDVIEALIDRGGFDDVLDQRRHSERGR